MNKTARFRLFMMSLIFIGKAFICQSQKIQILDSEQNKPISYVTVYDLEHKKGTYTDQNGIFELNSFPNSKELVLTSVGYQTKTIDLKNISGQIYLEPKMQALKEVVVNPSKKHKAQVIGNKRTKSNSHFTSISEAVMFMKSPTHEESEIQSAFFSFSKHIFGDGKRVKKQKILLALSMYHHLPVSKLQESILQKEITFELNPQQSKIKLDLSQEHLILPPEGAYIWYKIARKV